MRWRLSLKSSLAFKQALERLSPTLGSYARICAERVFEQLLSCSRTELYLSSSTELEIATAARIDECISRCAAGEPVDYVLGMSYFYDREFSVNNAVLIPRPDTELLVSTVLESEHRDQAVFADIGTGSGCIIGILCAHRKGWQGIGCDISLPALRIAQGNVPYVNAGFVVCNGLSVFSQRRPLDFLVSNPPYIASGTIAQLDASVKNHEPANALDGGFDGLDFYRNFAVHAWRYLKQGAWIYCEIGADQEVLVTDLFTRAGWLQVECYKDNGGNPRVVKARRPD